MKKRVSTMGLVFLLAACLNEKEVKEMTDEMTEKRNQAMKVLTAGEYRLEDLLIAQDYFFSFSEKVHLMKEDRPSLEATQKMIEKEGIQAFCEKFIVPQKIWTSLEAHCQSFVPYQCSPDMQAYPATQNQFLQLIGAKLAAQFQQEPSCQ